MTYRERRQLFTQLTAAMEQRRWPQAIALARQLQAAGNLSREQYEAVLAAYIDGDAPEDLPAAAAAYAAQVPQDGVCHFYLGRAALLTGDGRAAEAHFQAALADASLQGWYRGAVHSIYATLCRELGRTAEAAEHYRQSAQYKDIAHGKAAEYSNYLFNLHYLAREQPFMLAAAQGYGRLWQDVPQYHHDRAKHRRHEKIRVGYISPDLHFHVVAFFSYAFLHNYDHSRFEVYCYTNCIEDDASREFAAQVTGWRNVRGFSMAQAAEVVYRDEIDILFDLSGHTGWGLLPVLAYKPAPIQLSGIGYFDTTGLPAVDYFLADHYTDPEQVAEGESNDAYFTEKLLRLPHSHFCFMWHDKPPAPAPAPCTKKGYVTFGSFNNFSKVTDAMLALWRDILAQVPGSRLYLKAKIFNTAYGRETALARLRAAGIDPAHVICGEQEARYLPCYADVDIALDTYPYPGGGTTCDALYMGVPVITLVGRRHNARFGYSLLMNAGLPELCAFTPEEYVAKAVALAGDKARLRRYHQVLRRQLLLSPVMQAEDYMGDVEAAYQRIYRQWLGEAAPARQPVAWTVAFMERVKAVEEGKAQGQHVHWYLQQALAHDPAHAAELWRAAAALAGGQYRYEAGWRAAQQAEAALGSAPQPDAAGPDEFRCTLYTAGAKCALESGRAAEAVQRYQRAAVCATSLKERLELYSASLLSAHACSDDPQAEIAAHRGYAACFRAPEGGKEPAWPEAVPYTSWPRQKPHRRLRVGYLSPDFREHVMFAFYYQLLAAHTAGAFELYAYTLSPTRDSYTQLVERAVDHFVPVHGMDFPAVAARIHADEIDILVDLAGHTVNSGLPVLAWRPAPVQVSGLGYTAATGLPAVDYFLTDSAADPEPDGAYWQAFHEEPVVLTSQFCYTGRTDVPTPAGAPCMQRGYVTLGVFHRYLKYTDHMLRLWLQLQQALPTARLLLKNGALNDVQTAQAVYERLASLGFDMDRVVLEGADENYMRRMLDVDIMLDTFPYTGGGITCDALYMGVPVVSRYGQTRGSRFGLSVLTAAGLPELAVGSDADYVARVLALAREPQLLDTLHQQLRPMLLASPLMDTPRYVAEVEQAYRQMGQIYAQKTGGMQ